MKSEQFLSQSQKFPTFYGTRISIIALTIAQKHFNVLSQMNPVHTFPSNLKFILILSFHFRLGSPSGLRPLRFPSCMCLSPPQQCYMSCLSHPPSFDRPTNICRGLQIIPFPAASCCINPLRQRLPKHHILQHPQPMFFNVYMVLFLFDNVIYVFLLLCLYILIVCLYIFIVPTGTLRLP